MTHNFSAGPSILPKEVMKKASEAALNFDNGLSILEISHRSNAFVEVMENARRLVRELLNVPEQYEVLFLQGGATLGFYLAAENFMKKNGEAAYVNTGTWASKAIKEASSVGEIKVVASSEDKNFNYVPKGYGIPMDASYYHYTSNNTIFGTQTKKLPIAHCPILCDMSSDIFSKTIDVSHHDLIYAGAQKNMGTAGATLYIVNTESLGKTRRELTPYFDFKNHIDKDSMLNTPPVFSIYVSMLVLEWLKENGGIKAIEEKNEEKAGLIYGEIDNNPLFKGTAEKPDRSMMNATFVLENEALKDEFDKMWKDANISGIKGHRSVGGYRASMYNALPKESVMVLVEVMKEFGQKFG